MQLSGNLGKFNFAWEFKHNDTQVSYIGTHPAARQQRIRKEDGDIEGLKVIKSESWKRKYLSLRMNH